MDFVKGIPKLNPSVSYDALQLTPIEGFFLSRIDGFSSAEDIACLSGLSYEQSIEVLHSLWSKKVLIMEGMEQDSADAGIELNEDERGAIEKMAGMVERGTYYQILSLPIDTKPEQVKARFFELSKSFHPDRYFRRNIGRYENMLTLIFKKISEAFNVLYDPQKKRHYDRELARPPAAPAPPAPAVTVRKAPKQEKKPSAGETLEQKVAAIREKLDSGMTDQALKEAEALRDVRDPRIPLLLANYYLKENNALRARDHAQKAIEYDGKNVKAHELLGNVYMRFKLYRNALKVYETIVTIEPDNRDAVEMIRQIKSLIED